jgi:hypothetical protein
MTGFAASDGVVRRGEEPMSSLPEFASANPLPTRSDLLVVLSELNRIRESDGWSQQSASDVLTLATTAIRIVESQLATVGNEGLGSEDVSVARDVLQGVLHALRTALTRMDGEAPVETGRRSWLRRQRRKVPSSY